MTHDHGPWGRPAPAPPPPAKRSPRVLLWLCLLGALAALIAALVHAFPEAVRTGDDWARVVWAAGLVVLIATGIFRSGRMLRPQHLKYAAVWAGVIAVLALGFAYRDVLDDAARRLKLSFSAGDPVAGAAHEMIVPQDPDGGYAVVAKVNGQRVRFVVDTGATETVLSPDDARRIGVDVDKLSYVVESETANGVGYGAPFVADRLAVGPLVLPNFRLTVNKAPMSASLLGMTFLSRLQSFRVEDGNLILRWREAPAA